MPGVMYLKYLKSIRKMPGSQVRIWKDHCDGPETPICPHCGCAHVHIHGVTIATSFVPEKMVESGVLS